jgi:hypothetical protein
VTSTSDGTLYAGSFNLGGVIRIAAGGKAEQFMKPGAGDSRSTLGVLADEKSGLLYVCSNDITGFGVPGPSDTKGGVVEGVRSRQRRNEGQRCTAGSEIPVQRHCRWQ